mmetsp:Transcript_8400/g.16819  ORF Transcript_8400/g.16819 Transcript_8400/m.16819 type:complete len:461 (-) Transcript_8400:299-1681(-)|eukprot:CAMPEP_0118807918 /NCGR_PEP_ID=MMETSP1161-20130426/35716_1 /TAXON_ID=249345 /ORGANISM="Picochlorum oklahomensis, Strain CCMP2329" /LENGTH=460 /DNA_ID=CAMNT_0006737303 /DNA_START=2086 /DNA_END=3468 /DNA_ORIENTATION=+
MSQLAEIATNGTVGESEKMEGAAAQSVPEQVDTVSSHEHDTPEETPVEHGETTVPENFDISDSVQEKEKEDAAKDVDQLLEYLASNQLNLSGPASANLMSLLENSGYKTPETQTAEPSHSPRAHVVSPERKKAEDTNTGMLGQWPGMAVPQQAPVFTGHKVGTAFEGIEPRQTAVLDCPKAMVGRVIGKGGETIKALQQYTGAMIQIDQSTDPTRVTIAGSRQSLQLAISMVSDIIKGRFKGFAMLRQIAISSDGMGLGHPVYVQGYGFMPPSQAISATQSSGSVSPDVLPQRTGGMSAPLHRAPSPLNPGIVGLQDPQQGAMGNAYAGMPDLSSLSQFMNPPQYGTSAVQQQQQFGGSASQDAMLARLIQLAALEQQSVPRAPPATSQRDVQGPSEFLGQQQMPPFGAFVPQQQQPASSLGFYSDAFQGRMNEMDQRQASLFGSQTRSSDSSYFSGQQQ